MNAEETIARIAELEDEQYRLEMRLSQRAGEWYAAESGRRHFHRLEFTHRRGDGKLHFATPVRGGEIEVDIPAEWFAETP